MNLTPMLSTRQRWFVLLGLVGAMLVIQSSCALNPLLYSAKDASTTGFHQDLVATGNLSRTDAEFVLEEWATSLNLTGPVAHNLKLRNFESAERSFQQFRSSEQNLDALVFRLDLTDTDVATFQNDNFGNRLSLHSLLNQTREFDDLQSIEAACLVQKNISGLKAVELRGEDHRIEIRSIYKKYSDRSGRVISLSRKFGLDTSTYEQSLTDFAAILADIDAVQDARSALISEMMKDYQAGSAISLSILPDHGVYGDTLSMAGTANAPTGSEVTVFVDGLQAGRVKVGNDGSFSLPYRIEKIEVRSHTAYASIDSDISDVSSFTVDGGNTTISLGVRLVEENRIRKDIGTGRLLTENGAPVRWARVSLIVDGLVSKDDRITGDDGVYTFTTEQLSPGVHMLKARFDPGGFPLEGSESTPVKVLVLSHPDWLASLVYLLTVGGAGIGAVLFLRDRHAKGSPPSDGTVAAAPARLVEPSSMTTFEEARLMADQLTVSNEGRVDGEETIALTYRRLVHELEAKNPDLRLRSRTPRNLAVLFADEPFGDQLRALVGIHERIRYAEHEPTEEELHQVRQAFINIIVGGSGH